MGAVKDYFYYLLEQVTPEELESMTIEEMEKLNNELKAKDDANRNT